MKFLLPLLLLALSGLSAGLHAQIPTSSTPPDDFTPEKKEPEPTTPKIKYVLMMPEEKVSEAVKVTERNPFGKAEEVHIASGNKNTPEEDNIRGHLEKLKIVGVAPGPQGMRVMLGNMVLESGQKVPPVVADQTLSLTVGKITEHFIELVWSEKKNSGMPPRVLTLPVDLRPHVRYALLGQASEKPAATKPTSKGSTVALGTKFLQLPQQAAEEGKTAPRLSSPSPPAADVSASPLPNAEAPPDIRATPSASAAPEAINPKTADSWERGLGMLNNLVKLDDQKK